MSDFIPPYPLRYPTPLPAWKRFLLASRNVIGMWEEEDFERDFSSARLLSRHAFLCNSPEAVRFAFSSHNASFERKSPQMRHALSPLLGDGLFISDGETWRTRRRMVAPIVHVSRLPEFAPAMVGAAAEARERWMALPEGTCIDILSESATLTADIICRALFGRHLSRDYAAEIIAGFTEYQRLIGQTDLISFLGLPDWVPRWYGGAIRRIVARMHAVLDKVIESYRTSGARESAVIGRLIEARDEEAGALSAEALRNEIAVLFMAGHETTANSLAWTWYLLSQTPEVEARLHAEIDRVLAGRLPALSNVPALPYTRAVFEEAMRLYPPVPVLPREALREERFGDRVIPRGSLIFVVPWLLHRHRKLWEKPDHFIPERFLPENAGKISKFAYVPFSIGPRICAGMSFGLTEAILSLATLAQAFSLRLQPGHAVKPVARLTLRPQGGLPMTLHRRPPPHR